MVKKIIIKSLVTFVCILGIYAPIHAQKVITPGNCFSYTLQDNKVDFLCENNINVQLELIDQGIVKIWIDTNHFQRTNPSFAVVKDGEFSSEINLSEQPGHFEIYTGDLILKINKSPFKIQIFDKYQKLLLDDYQDRGFVFDSLEIASCKTLKPGERIYGLGEKTGSIDRTGKSFKMWNSDKPCYNIYEDPLYKSIPFFMSSEDYAIFFDNTYKSVFQFAYGGENNYSFSAPGGEMIYYFIYGPSLKQIIHRYAQLTGQPIMPPAWGLGFSQCRGLLTNEQLTREIAKGFRERKIPCDIIYQDIGWTQYLQDFEWRDGNYDDPVTMLSDLKNDGFKVIVSQDPVISQANTPQWNEADSLGYFAKDARNNKSYDMPWPWGGNCGVVDFTNPEVADWWGAYQQKAIADGVSGFWTDMGEPAWSNEESTDRLFMKHHLGMHNEIHNVYGLTWDKVVTEQFEKHNPNTRIFQMTRSGFAGMQRYTFGWSGDAGNGEDVTQGWGQLQNQLPMALSAGMCGIPFWSCDISGYCGDITDCEATSELYVRWMQFGVFNPISRAHHEGNNAVEPWLFGDEAEAICKKSIELKYQLFPYIYAYAREAFDTGLPLMRALLLEYSDDPEVFGLDSEFMFGSELLVAPVLEEGAADKEIYFPKGYWIDFNHPETSYPGNQWVNFPVDIETIPLFVKQGSIIPMMPVMQYIGEDVDYPLIVHIFPATVNKKANFEVYEDDGETNNYKQEIFIKRKITCTSKRFEFEIVCTEMVKNDFDATSRNFIYKIHLDQEPAMVYIGDQKVKKVKSKNSENSISENLKKSDWIWNSKNGVCSIRVLANAVKDKIIVKK